MSVVRAVQQTRGAGLGASLAAACLGVSPYMSPIGAWMQLKGWAQSMGGAPAEYLGHEIGTSSPAEIDELRRIYTAIRDGEASWSTVLESKRGSGEKAEDKAAVKLKEKLAKSAAGDKQATPKPDQSQ